VDVAAAGNDVDDRCRRQFSLLAGDGQQLRAVGEELRRATFVGLDVRQLLADDTVVRLAKRGECQ
jgi:hypothetical protein